VKLLVIGLLAAGLSVLLTVTLLLGYGRDQHVVRWFPGTGIAAKVDVAGTAPSYVSIANRQTGEGYTFRVLEDGTFVAPLPLVVLKVPREGWPLPEPA
jgi:hypothetical protein